MLLNIFTFNDLHGYLVENPIQTPIIRRHIVFLVCFIKRAWAACGDTELAPAVDEVMARAKRIYILIIKVNKLFSFFLSWCFLKEIENLYFVFLSSYRVWENAKKLWKHSLVARVPTAFLVTPNFHSCFYLTVRLQARVFYEPS